MKQFDSARRSTERKRMQGTLSRPVKPKTWSHQDELAAYKGKKVRLYVDDSHVEGMLLEADAFVVKIQIGLYRFDKIGTTAIDLVADQYVDRCYFRHAIRSFELSLA